MTPEATIADRFDVFLFDLDGVIHVGEESLPDAVESVGRLQAMGRQVRILTNDPRPRRRTIAGRPRTGAGAVIRAVEAAAGTEPTVVGKPEQPMFEIALEGRPDGALAVVVGDSRRSSTTPAASFW